MQSKAIPPDGGIPPIGQLPVEALTSIFAHLLDISADGPLRVSHVCKHWRAAAISCKQVWANISGVCGLEWIKLELARSEPVPLQVQFSRDSGDQADYYDKARSVLGALSRIEIMDFTVKGSSTLERLMPVVGLNLDAQGRREMFTLLNASPAPLLQSLSFTVRNVFDRRCLSPTIFSGVTPPNLKCFKLRGCAIPTGFHLLTAPLTHLELHTCTGWDTMDQFLDTLSLLPTLQELILYNDTVTRRIVGVLSGREDGSVFFPHLNRLDLHDEIITIAHILRYLSFPSNVHMTIEPELGPFMFELPPQTITDLYEVGLRPRLASSFRQGESFDACAIEFVEGADDGGFTMTATRMPKNDVAETTSALPRLFRFSIHRHARINPEQCISLLQMLMRLPGLTDPKTTVLHVGHPDLLYEATHWRAVAAACHGATTVTVEGLATHGFVDVLKDDTTVFFPELAIVNIKGADLTTDRRHPYDAVEYLNMEQPTIPVITKLTEAFARRGALEFPPVSVTISECDVSAEKVQALGKPLGNAMVSWDGKEHGLLRARPAVVVARLNSAMEEVNQLM